MMAKITQLGAASEHHTVEFAILRGAISYVQRGIWWMREHQDYDGDDEFDDTNYSDDAVADQLIEIPLSFVTKKESSC